MGKRVILLTEIISPYRIPVFNEIAASFQGQFHVLFLGESEKRRSWKIYKDKIRFRYEVLAGLLFQAKGSTPYFFNPGVFLRLLAFSPDTIICSGYYQPSSLFALTYAKLYKRRLILWFESNKYEERPNSLLRESYKRWFIWQCQGYIVPGKASFEYLVSLGARPENIHIAANAVDNDFFTKTCEKYKADKEKLKHSMGYPEKLILYVGRLIDQKGIADLLKAFQGLSAEQPGLGLLLIGSGERQPQYMEFCEKNRLKNVFFPGFIQQENLALYYALSDVFVLPAHSDPWGLVLNEAMACGLPVIASQVTGAAQDLIVSGVNGYIYSKGEVDELANRLADTLSSPQKKETMGLASQEIIRKFSPQECAKGIIEAIKAS